MIEKIFIKNYNDVNNPIVRSKYGVLAGVMGIITNFILALGKILIGFLFASAAIMADGINNLSDGLNSLITIIGFRLSSKGADKDHPFGHERIEYITGLIVSLVIVVVGLLLSYNSVLGIIELIKGNSEELLSGNKILVFSVLGGSIILKFIQGMMYNHLGKKIDSDALFADAKDSFLDCISTVGVIISSFIYLISKGSINIDSIVSLGIGVYIVITGIGLIKETSDPLLGVEAPKEMVDELVEIVTNHHEVLGIHDLVIHSYGPNKFFATLHAEVDSTVDVMETHEMIDNIEREVYHKMHILLTIHMDPIVVNDPLTEETKEIVKTIINDISPDITFHDFRILTGPHIRNIIFDIVRPFDCKYSKMELIEMIFKKVQEHNEQWYCVITVDDAYTDAHFSRK